MGVAIQSFFMGERDWGDWVWVGVTGCDRM